MTLLRRQLSDIAGISFTAKSQDVHEGGSTPIHDILNGELPAVVRAKGHFWIATRPEWVAEFSLAEQRKRPHLHGDLLAEARGDRRQEIVFIGAGIDWPVLKTRLDAALMPERLLLRPTRCLICSIRFPPLG